MGTPRFNRMVGDWISAWVAHMKQQGLKPGQLQLLLVDEPQTPEQDEIILKWSQAIRAAQPRSSSGATRPSGPTAPTRR